jgi:hypothetical protein
MPGTPEELTEQQQAPDPVRPRESDSVKADLQERMERLPPGHPSSPYNEDGSRKPPAPDPFQNDSPIPGDPDYQPEALSSPEADQDRDASPEIHRNEPRPTDGGFDQELPTEDPEILAEDREGVSDRDTREREERRLSQIADQAIERCREAEGRDADGNYADQGLTPAMRRIEEQVQDGKLAPETEEHAIKSVDRFKGKLAEMVRFEPDKSAEELAAEIHDGIRYTFLLDLDKYFGGVQELTSNLETAGFELGVRKNTWSDAEYKGINTRWLDHQSGLRFEVQFHTEQSWQVKQQTHDAYAKIQDTTTTAEEREDSREYQREMSAQVLPPPGCEQILDFRREGW